MNLNFDYKCVMRNLKAYSPWLITPNFLSCYRIFISPILILIALLEYKILFLFLFTISLLTDSIDGYLARKLKKKSKLGAKLDGLADVTIWTAGLVCLFILWPEIAKREVLFGFFALFAFILPMIVGFLKYKEVPFYHCYSGKIHAVLMSISALLLVLTNIPWPFRFIAITQSIVAIEDICITILLPKCHYDIPSVWHAIKLFKKRAKVDK